MQNLKHFREALGQVADEYSDSQLEQLQRDIVIMADLLVELFTERTARNHSRLTPDR
jgi:hypothetical protein